MSEGENSIPINELDLQAQLTNPVWGKENINPDLMNKLIKPLYKQAYKDEKTNEIVVPIEKIWSQLSFFTRDFRLGNLSAIFGEVTFCHKYTDLAGDLLSAGMVDAFTHALRRPIGVIEISQSRGGFFRKRSNTVTNENYVSPLEPQKKGIFGGNKNNDNDYGRRYV